MLKNLTFCLASLLPCCFGQAFATVSTQVDQPKFSYEGTGEDAGCLFKRDGGHIELVPSETYPGFYSVDLRTVGSFGGLLSYMADDKVTTIPCTLKLRIKSAKPVQWQLRDTYLPVVGVVRKGNSIGGSIKVTPAKGKAGAREVATGYVLRDDSPVARFHFSGIPKSSECRDSHDLTVSFSFQGRTSQAFDNDGFVAVNGPQMSFYVHPCQ